MIYPNQYYVDFGGGNGNQFKNVYIGSERILTKKARVAPDREHWYYHTDHVHSTGMVTDEKGDMVDAVHYFPFGEVWLEEVPSSLPVDYFFTAKELDSETGLYDFGKRYFNPALSMWMTADPALGKYLGGRGHSRPLMSPFMPIVVKIRRVCSTRTASNPPILLSVALRLLGPVMSSLRGWILRWCPEYPHRGWNTAF